MELTRLCGPILGLVALTVPAAAQAAETTDAPRRRGPAYSAVELQGLFIGEMVPKPFFGIDGAYAIGSDSFYFRIGAAASGSPAFQLAQTKVANTLQYGQADVCAGKAVHRHRIRMCLGGEAGAWRHIWKSTQRGQRLWSPHLAGTLKADYTFGITDTVGVIFGVGVSVPMVGPSFQGRDQYGRPSSLVIPGPVAGSARLGVVLRFR
jgi:hypothetical protein